MGNILQAIRVSVLHKRIAALVQVMPKSTFMWKKQSDVVSIYSSSRGGMTISLEKAQEPKTELAWTQEPPLKELDLGSGEIASSGDLRGISLCTDLDADDLIPPSVVNQRVEAYEEIPIVDWDYMTCVPVCTWEEIVEEQLWDDYTRQHSPPAGIIPIEEFYGLKERKDSTTIDVTEGVDGDTVILFQRSRRNRGSDADQSEKGYLQRDHQVSNNSKPKWNRFAFLSYPLFKRFRITDPIVRPNRSFLKEGMVT